MTTSELHEVGTRVEPLEMGQCLVCFGWFPLVWITSKLKGIAAHEGDDRVREGRYQ